MWNGIRHIFQAEYKCHGPGSDTFNRAPWSKQLNDQEAEKLISVDFIDGTHWLPAWHWRSLLARVPAWHWTISFFNLIKFFHGIVIYALLLWCYRKFGSSFWLSSYLCILCNWPKIHEHWFYIVNVYVPVAKIPHWSEVGCLS